MGPKFLLLCCRRHVPPMQLLKGFAFYKAKREDMRMGLKVKLKNLSLPSLGFQQRLAA